MAKVSQADIEAIRKSGLFDEKWYLEQYPDVKALGMDPVEHYLWVGKRLGRNPILKPHLPGKLNNTTVSGEGHINWPAEEGSYPAEIADERDVSFVEHRASAPIGDRINVNCVAFYLPQYHPIPENDQWWGRGFTEWTNVSKSRPQFFGHYQPHLPGELGYYDLRLPEVMRQQVELAKLYGIYGFCFHYYWFSGKRLLDRPINQYLEDKNLDFPFCFCWANENWTRRWDGKEADVLINQLHTPETDIAFINEIIPAMRDRRYIKYNGRPILLIYRVTLMPDPIATARRWRHRCIEAGVGNPYLVAVRSFDIVDPRPLGFDAAVEFPPHHSGHPLISESKIKLLNPRYRGKIFDYAKMAANFMEVADPGYVLLKTACPSWDNEARKPGAGHTFHGASPQLYETWLRSIVRRAHRNAEQEADYPPFVFINAWNEWAEGAHLEPDRRYGYAFLQATRNALAPLHEEKSSGERTRGAPRVSIIVPSYNHEKYLRKRLNSIYEQSYHDFEVILLDDASTDGSVAILEEYRNRYKEKTRLYVNATNSGSPFKQWSLGIAKAAGQIIWIAESDDSCDANFLGSLLPAFDSQSVLLAYGDIQYVDELDCRLEGLDEYRKSTGYMLWADNYTIPAFEHFRGAFGVKNIIANVSGALFRKPYLPAEFVEYLSEFRVCGDWIFYMHVARGGEVHYTSTAKSYFRQHEKNTSVRALYEEVYYREHGRVANNLKRLYNIDASAHLKFRRMVEETYNYIFLSSASNFSFRQAFERGELEGGDSKRRFNVLVSSLGFYLGGGEIVPIHLANALYRRGHNVTFFAHGYDSLVEEWGVRQMLEPGIAVVRREDIERDPAFFRRYGIEVINSHNVGIEFFFRNLVQHSRALPRYVVTHHGSYEAATPPVDLMREFASFVDHWIYLSEKNLAPLRAAAIDVSKSSKVGNGLPCYGRWRRPATREEFAAGADDFICVVASRAIPEKGWDIAIDAVSEVNSRGGRRVYLLLVGEGVEYDRLKGEELPPFVTLLGFRNDVARIYGVADIGLLPTTYPGESFPLSLVECLLEGKPCIATDVGEIRSMLTGDDGAPAGVVLSVGQRERMVRELAQAIYRLANDMELYAAGVARARLIASRYSIDRVAETYEAIFERVCRIDPSVESPS